MNSSQKQTERKRILIASATVGSGHNSAAAAIAAGLESARPDLLVEQADVLQFAPWAFRAYYAGGFAMMMTHFQWCYGIGFRISNRPQGPNRTLPERRRLWTERMAMRSFGRKLRQNPPDLVISTHFLAPPLIGRLIERNHLRTRQFVAVTDIDVHRFWYARNVERWFVAHDPCAEPLVRWGIDPGSIFASGIPIHAKWSQPLDREKIFADWRLPTDKKIVLLSGGTEFTCGPIVKTARQITAACPDAYVVVLAGRNKKLLGRLSQLKETPARLVGVGFTDRLHELGEVASLMVTKSGGITTAECLAKAVPMILPKPVPGHEAGNARFLAGAGAAVIVPRHNRVAAMVAELLGDSQRLTKMAEQAKRLYRPGTETIVAAACQALDDGD